MIPSIVARQTRETVLDYLRTTFSLADQDFEAALQAFLESPDGMFRGPFVDVRLPFRQASEGARIPLEIAPSFRPYRHQLLAFQRLFTRGGHQPQPTLVTTGTGSGKTECFLYPVLDHCYRERGKPGIKAILLYPMNALAADQARRLAETLWDDPRLRGQVRAGLFVGGEGRHQTASREHLVDDRKVLRQSPPDILLTNYRMLDFLLLRPEDQTLWRDNAPDTLRFLVLDELHTYDGAQGSDVACLIRRLRARLAAPPGTICPVGTSATIGGTDQESGTQALLRFATDVFGVEFLDEAVITEDRCNVQEALGRDVDEQPPLPDDGPALDPKNHESIDDWVQAQIDLWMPGLATDRRDPVGVGRALARHGFLRHLLRGLGGRLQDVRDLDAWLLAHEAGWSERSEPVRRQLLDSFLGLVSWARKEIDTPAGTRKVPFLNVQIQLWMRELRHLVSRVGAEPVFSWEPDVARAQDAWLPVAYCRSCGTSGWATVQREAETRCQTEPREIGRAWFQNDRTCRFVSPGRGDDPGLFPQALDPQTLELREWTGEAGQLEVVVGDDLSEGKVRRFLARCPRCDADTNEGLSILGSRAASLLSVAINHLFQSGYNADKKLLAFTDSVQDASHRAGFFTARTYRFNLRTAIQGVLESQEDDVALPECAAQILDWTAGRPRGSLERAVATLWPGDLVDLGEYQQFLQTGRADDAHMLDLLRARLSWELAMEFGHNVRIGRTLEKTGCATTAIDEAGLDRAVEMLTASLADGDMLEGQPNADAGVVRHFVLGLLQRVRAQGGIDHPLVHGFIQSEGRWFKLTKSVEPLLSPFGSRSPLPRFLVDRPPHVRQVFPSIVSPPGRLTWYRDWAARCLGVDPKDGGITALYREALRRLTDAGVLVAHKITGGHHAFGINGKSMRLTRHVQRIECSTCGAVEHVPAAARDAWVDQVCTRYRCRGTWTAVDDKSSYYGRRYRSGFVERIIAREHTGLLVRSEREDLEKEFKAGDGPASPNLLVTTPTLEMGVDIGDLSATVLCSVPPTTANYLQRVGRAGRRTGNALCVTLAESRPHDLYFQAAPLAMMRGQVEPPGCFLDAPEMLRRQLVAFAMDCWAMGTEAGTQIPARTTLILGHESSDTFPGSFLRFYETHHGEIVDRFLSIFEATITAANVTRLREYATPDEVARGIRTAFDRIRAEREEYGRLRRRTSERIRDIEADRASVEDAEKEIREQEAAQRLFGRLITELGQKYPLNVLTDAGVLPNYAFPEPGVTLRTVIRHKGGDDDVRPGNVSQDYMRPASSAIRELAPWNTFYADGRKYEIQELDLGPKTNPLDAAFRLCANCSHAVRELPETPVAEVCPRCGDPSWSDAGQVRQLLRFERARSMQTDLEARSGDDGDERKKAYYEVLALIDVARENHNGARWVQDLPFGIELLKNLALREINFGPQAAENGGDGLQVAGRTITTRGFPTCRDCGRVRAPHEDMQHASWCRSKKDELRPIHLYREVQSEAIRVLLPIASYSADSRMLSFRAALALGFRKRFAGDPQHLQIRLHDEPGPDGTSRLRFLVIYDSVPGGTGYLSELWHGDNFRSILELALRTLEECGCQRREVPGDGCYECLYAYQDQYSLKQLTSREARDQIRAILDRWADMTSVDTLSGADLGSRLESELEERFVASLRRHVESRGASWSEIIRRGDRQWRFTWGDRSWLLVPQESLAEDDGVDIQSRPDFLLKPADGDRSIRPLAVFCDGFRFHASPDEKDGRIFDDVIKRRSICDSGRWQVFGVTWADIDEFDNETLRPGASSLQLAVAPGKIDQRMGTRALRGADAQLPTMLQLLRYLEHPVAADWEMLADSAFLVWLAETKGSTVDAAACEQRLLREPLRFDASEEGPGTRETDDAEKARLQAGGAFAALARWRRRKVGDEPAGVRLVLRLFDEWDERRGEGFEAAWRAFLATWNLAQFLPGLVLTTSEELVHGADGSGSEPAPRPAGEPADPIEDDPILADATPEERELIAIGRAAGLGDPELGGEPADDEGISCGMSVMLWEDARIALVLDEHREDQKRMEAAGWTLCDAEPSAFRSLLAQDGAAP